VRFIATAAAVAMSVAEVAAAMAMVKELIAAALNLGASGPLKTSAY